ncbi:MAG: hypothetical protein ACR2J7_08035 [Luteimonas sp.]
MLPVVLAVACGPASAALLSVQGDARDPASERLLYREDHLLRRDDDVPVERVVLYRCPDGTAFARKRVDYRDSRIAPAFSLVDARDGYREGLRRTGDKVSIYSGKRSAPLQGDTRGVALVADAGFDEFLRKHWDALHAQDSLPIRFAVPSHVRDLKFNVRSLGRGTVAGVPVQTFQLKLGGLLALVSPRIDVAYHAGDRSLRRYTGLTNIRSNDGKPLEARIDFANPAQAVAGTQWQAALDAPLARCTIGA